MGIDAEMFAIVHGKKNWLKPSELLKTSYDLASALGHEKFFIDHGEWNGGKPQHHALSIVGPCDDKEQLDYYDVPDSLRNRPIWMQDGDPVIAEEDQQFIEVHLYTRYYGETYARGSWPSIMMTAKWLQLRFPGCTVMYGGDSSGVVAEPLTERMMTKLTNLWLSSGTRNYHGAFAMGGEPSCSCPRCLQPMSVYGWGGGGNSYFCSGCGGKAFHDGKHQYDAPRAALHDEASYHQWEQNLRSKSQ